MPWQVENQTFAFLFVGYKPKFKYWETLNMLRKLTVIVIVTFIRHSALRIYAAMWSLTAFCLLQKFAEPFVLGYCAPSTFACLLRVLILARAHVRGREVGLGLVGLGWVRLGWVGSPLPTVLSWGRGLLTSAVLTTFTLQVPESNGDPGHCSHRRFPECCNAVALGGIRNRDPV